MKHGTKFFDVSNILLSKEFALIHIAEWGFATEDEIRKHSGKEVSKSLYQEDGLFLAQ
jgi:hypothetical protein